MDNLEDLILLPEEDKKIIDPSDEEIFTCAEMFEVNLIEEPYLKKAIKANMTSKMPADWKTYENKRGEIIY